VGTLRNEALIRNQQVAGSIPLRILFARGHVEDGSMISLRYGNRERFAQEALGPERSQGVRLEEIEKSDAGEWLITLSMIDPEPFNSVSEIMASMSGSHKRIYKIFTVHENTGTVLSMKMREFSNQ